ncbi:hypothetical protein DL764_008422 [Monosporascus ibericus]|uniref:Uncharacterized protein n=1 Tax=Monosporascus ibericus TaxID=155417 RepID=A0A4V1X995_9PEZI|nr:hypothetical protein DL764_008422 [Monosporascus ibericus]
MAGSRRSQETSRHLMSDEVRFSDENDRSDFSFIPVEPKLATSQSRIRQSWMYSHCLGRLTGKHYFIGLAALLVIMVFCINPYRSPFTAHQSSEVATGTPEPSPSHGGSKPASDEKFGIGRLAETSKPEDKSGTKEKGVKETDEPYKLCTTWPVNKDGTYTPQPKTSPKLHLDSYAPEGGWKKPKGIAVVAMIFYGRKRNVDILDCYLRQNLASNGGYLDEVWFMVHTTVQDDVEWLENLAATEPGYKFVDLGDCTTGNYGCMWEYAVADDTIYIKIDDDILYIHHDAIPQLVHTRLAQPHPFAISTQLVNGPVTGIQQYSFGATHPFLPDPRPRSARRAVETWRPVEMGLYPSDSTKNLPAEEGESDKKTPVDLAPSYAGHAWLLLSDSPRSSIDLLRTPMGYWNEHRIADIAHGIGWTSWGVAAQSAYSLLHNIATNQMSRYHWGRAIDFGFPTTSSNEDNHSKSSNIDFFDGKGSSIGLAHAQAYAKATTAKSKSTTPPPPGGEQLFDMQYVRYNLNFVAIWGRDVRDSLPIGAADEEELSQTIPRRLGRPFVIDTRAVVGHHSFFTQREGIERTDLLDRWRALANEVACDASRGSGPKAPFDGRCPGF